MLQGAVPVPIQVKVVTTHPPRDVVGANLPANYLRYNTAGARGDCYLSRYLMHKAANFPIEKMIKYYDAKDFQTAFDDMKATKTIKPVLVWSKE